MGYPLAMRRALIALFLLASISVTARSSQRGQAPPTPEQAAQAARQAELRGSYDRYRANNDLLHYALTVRVDPERKFISGRNAVRFKMLSDDTRIRLDLYANLTVDKIAMGGETLKFERELNAVFIDFPAPLRKGRTYEIECHYSGMPLETGRFGGLAFRKDPAGRHWINTANEGEGSSIWWPSKDQWRDEVESMDLSVEVPNGLTDVSNGRFMGKKDLGDGYTRWDWRIHYPINSYNVSLNIGTYEHFGEKMGDLTLDYWVLPENVARAKVQFAQTKPMLEAFEHYFGEYPFPKDGFKLIEVPYSGMEHQSAVTYGNRFANGYLERDWTGVGISTKFDFIIIHESAHEWFGNAVSAADVSDMWIQEGWTTYLECLYVERLFGPADGLKYTNAYKTKIQNRTPIITERGFHRTPPQDMYFKGALFLHTLRGIVNNDDVWWKLIKDFYQAHKYKNIMTEDMVAFFNERLKRDLTPIFNQYLRRTAVPTLELDFTTIPGSVRYRWKADEPGFNMPIRIRRLEGTQTISRTISPTTEWQTMSTPGTAADFEVATELYYVLVEKR
jgi:aminopeptidase N